MLKNNVKVRQLVGQNPPRPPTLSKSGKAGKRPSLQGLIRRGIPPEETQQLLRDYSDEVLRRTLALVERLELSLEQWRVRALCPSSLLCSIRHWADLYRVGQGERALKAITVNLSARVLHQKEVNDIGGFESVRWLLSGSGYRGIRRRFRDAVHHPKRASSLRFALDLLNIKRGSPAVSDELVESEKVETFKQLTTTHAWESPFLREKTMYDAKRKVRILSKDPDSSRRVSSVLSALCDTVEYVFAGGSRLLNRELQRPIPGISRKAHFGFSREDLGAYGYLKTKYEEYLQGSNQVVETQLTMDYHPRIGVVEWKRFLPIALQYDLHSDAAIVYSELVGLPEPLKVRVISKGSPASQTLLRPLQKVLWSQVSSKPQFLLTGSPVTGQILEGMFPSLGAKEFFVSGDFKAATNLLAGPLSSVALNLILDQLSAPPLLREEARANLTDSFIVDPTDETKFEAQMNGQLMGSVISFPILCIINFAVLLAVLREWHPYLRAERLPVLVNGDDILFTCNSAQYLKWKSWATSCGLVPSLGKNYCSRHFVMINSTLFKIEDGPFVGPTMPLKESSHRMVEVAYLNYSHLARTAPKGLCEQRSILDLCALTSKFSELPPALEGFAMRLFFRRYRRDLETLPNGISWSLPPHLGGLGIHTQVGYAPEVTFVQRCIAFQLFIDDVAGAYHGPRSSVVSRLRTKLCPPPTRMVDHNFPFPDNGWDGFYSHAADSYADVESSFARWNRARKKALGSIPERLIHMPFLLEYLKTQVPVTGVDGPMVQIFRKMNCGSPLSFRGWPCPF